MAAATTGTEHLRARLVSLAEKIRDLGKLAEKTDLQAADRLGRDITVILMEIIQPGGPR